MAMATAMVPTAVVPTAMVVAMVATSMAPTAVVPTITADTAMPTMKQAVPDGQSPGGGGSGHDIPSRPPGAPDGGYHRAMQQAGNGRDGVAFAAEDRGHEDEAYFGGPFSSVFGGSESGHGPTSFVLQLPTSGRSNGTGCDIPRSPPQYSGSNNGYSTNRGPQQQHGSGSRSYRAKPFVRHYRGGDGTTLLLQQQRGPRPFCSFGWEQRGACRNGPPVNGLANSTAQGQAQRDVEMGCHGGPVSKVSKPRRQPHRWQEGGPLYRHATSDGCNHLAVPSHRQPPLSRTWPLRSDSNRTSWRCRCSPCQRGSGSSHRTPLYQLGGRPRCQL